MKITKRTTPNGDRYQVRWRTRAGVQRARTFTTKREAETFRATVQTDLDRGKSADPRPARTRFDTWADEWTAAYLVGRPSTTDRDLSILQTHVRPEFGDLRLGDITRRDVQRWLGRLADGIPGRGHGRPLSPATITKCHQVLAKILDAAVADDLIPTNPARGVTLPKAERDERRFLTEDEVVALEDAMQRPEDRLLVAFLADSGLRIGEAAALRWHDLDLAAGTVHVRATAGEARGRGVVVNGPKTRKGRRRVPTLTDGVIVRLAAHRGGAPGDALVFPSPQGAHLRTRHYRARVWRPAVERAGLADPLPTPHSLRHTAVSRWIAAGIEPHQVAEFAGHSSIATVYAIYGHLLDVDVSGPRAVMAARRAEAEARRGNAAEVLRLVR